MRKPKTGVCFTFHVGTRDGKLYKHQGFSLTGTFISSMALTTLKSYNFGFMLISLWKQLHSTPKRQTLLILSFMYQTGRRRNGWNIYCLKYNQSSKLRKTNVHLQKKKIKTIFHSSQATFYTNTRLWNVPFKNCTYCSSFQPKCIIFIPPTRHTKTSKHHINLCVFKRHRRATTADMIQRADRRNQSTNSKKLIKLKPLVCWGMSEGFHSKRGYSPNLITQV